VTVPVVVPDFDSLSVSERDTVDEVESVLDAERGVLTVGHGRSDATSVAFI
jgi:hypothetical protein